MPSGGPRPGSGRKPVKGVWREWCRGILEDPKILKLIRDRAEVDPDFALRIAEHGFGRPPQALKVSGNEDDPTPITYVAEIAGGSVDPSGASDVPDAGLELGGTD